MAEQPLKEFPPIIFAGLGPDIEIDNSRIHHRSHYPSVMIQFENCPEDFPPPFGIAFNTPEHITEGITNLSMECPFPRPPSSYHPPAGEHDLPSLQLLHEQHAFLQSQSEETFLDQDNLPQASSLTLFSRIHAAYYQHVFLGSRDHDTTQISSWYEEFNHYTQGAEGERDGIKFITDTINNAQSTPEEGTMGVWVKLLEELAQEELPGQVEYSKAEGQVGGYGTAADQQILVAVDDNPGLKRKRVEVDEPEEWVTKRTCGLGRNVAEGKIARDRTGAMVAEEPRDFGKVFRAVKKFFWDFIPDFFLA